MNLEYIHTTEGRIRVAGSNYYYDYYLKDHLGNTRVVFTDENNDNTSEVLQVDNYYPFGMRHGQANTFGSGGKTTQYMYNGKELQEDFNLDWYDYGARMYDPALGRWHCLDPLADDKDYVHLSPYNYAANNPIFFIDPDGRGIFPSIAEFVNSLQQGLQTQDVQNSSFGTYCNRYMVQILNDAGDMSFGSYENLSLNANEIGMNLRNSNVATELSQEEAISYAKQGVTVIASYVSNNSNTKSGHLAIVDPCSGLTCSPSRGKEVLSVYNMGPDKKHGTLAETFGTKGVKFFILNHDLEEINRIYPGRPIDEVKVEAKGVRKMESKPAQVSTGSTSQFQKGRLNPGDYGYNGSFWQAYDDVKNFGNENN